MSKKTKSVLFFMLLGFLIILVSQIIITLINFMYIRYQFAHLDFDEFRKVSNSFSSQIKTIITMLIFFCSQIFAGYFVSKRIKEKGILYSSILGLIWFIFVLLISLIPFFLPDNLVYGNRMPETIANGLRQAQINALIAEAQNTLLITIALTTVGGLISKYFRKSFKFLY